MSRRQHHRPQGKQERLRAEHATAATAARRRKATARLLERTYYQRLAAERLLELAVQRLKAKTQASSSPGSPGPDRHPANAGATGGPAEEPAGPPATE